MAWLPSTVPSTDKRFLANTLRHTLASNRLLDRRGPPDRRERGDAGVAVPSRPSHGVRRGGSRTDGQRREAGGRTSWRGGGKESERADRVAEAEGSARTERGETKGEIARTSRVGMSEEVRRKRVDRNGRGLSDGETWKEDRSSDINHEGRLVKKAKR